MAFSCFFMYAKTKASTMPKLQSELCLLMASGCRRVNNPTLWDFCVSVIGRGDVEGSKKQCRYERVVATSS